MDLHRCGLTGYYTHQGCKIFLNSKSQLRILGVRGVEEASSTLRTYKHYVPLYKIYFPQGPGTQHLCTSDTGHLLVFGW